MNRHILLIEDSRTQAESLRHVLESHDYRVHWAPGAENALESLRNTAFDLVVTDILMPGMDGFELCQAIKREPSTRSIPVILLTALSEPKDVIRGLECGADSFVPKPYEESMLLSRIKYTLDNAATPAETGRTVPTEIHLQESTHTISSSPKQIVNFLLGAYETALRKNEESVRSHEELEKLNAKLEGLVDERTAALREEIQERKKIHDALIRSEEHLRHAHKMEAVGQLAGGVAHDFNNLLTAINGYSDLLLARADEGDENWEYLNLIRQAGERASSLTSQLLAFGRRQMLAPRLLDINQAAGNICKLLGRLIGTHILLDFQPLATLWMTKVDPTQIEQVIMNLLLNARDAMTGGGTITVRTDNTILESTHDNLGEIQAGEYVMISVSDTGIGMDDSIRSRIFEPFFTTKDKSKGSGLGLATAYGIIKQSGGHIDVHSAPGKGSRFRVFLPKAPSQAEANPGASSGKPLPAARGGNETILVAEDEEPIRRLVVGLLKSKNYNVMSAQDGASALQLASGFDAPIDLLITDLTMPHVPGRELARKLLETRPDTKVLYMSGFSEDMAVAQEGLGPGSEFLSKPFSAQIMLLRVREILDRIPAKTHR